MAGQFMAGQLQRPYFSPRQVVTADDLNAGVDYTVERLRRHNRFLHGCGIVCGLEISADLEVVDDFTSLLTLVVQAGQAISPQGDMISVPNTVITFTDVRVSSDPFADREPLMLALWQGELVYLVLRYATTDGDLRARLPARCASSDSGKTPARIADSFEFDLTTILPDTCGTTARELCGSLLDELLRYDVGQVGAALPDAMLCPPDTDDPWLVVAQVLVRFSNNGWRAITDYSERALLPSTRLLLDLIRCLPDAPRIDHIDSIPLLPNTATRWYNAVVTGKGFTPLNRVEVDSPEMPIFSAQTVDDQTVSFIYFVRSTLPPGKHVVTVVTPFDRIDSAKCNTNMDVPQPASGYPYSYGYAYGYGYGGKSIGEDLL